MDFARFSAAMKAASTPEKANAPDVQEAIASASKTLAEVGRKFEERSRRVEREIKRGAHLTSHRINL